jgi:tetratricopeptide (TPR) repeat protein
MAEGYVTVKPLGARPVKGLETPLDVYEITGAAAVRSRLNASLARGLTPFVGRDAEMDRLQGALERARGGHGEIVAVVGEAGVGKSRLFWEFTRSHHTAGWRVFESSSVSYGKASSYLPVIELLRAYFRVEERDDPRTVREKVTGKLLALDEGLRPLLTPVLSLFEAAGDDPEWSALDPSVRRQRTLDAVKHVLVRESGVLPLVVVLEDLHWIDGETQLLLDGLVESLPTARIILLVNYRPEYQHGWSGKSYYTQIRIDPLTARRAEELLETLLGREPALQPLWRLLTERTAGNPFFLEETVRTLVETGIVDGTPGAYRLARPVNTIQVPATVQAVLAARIDRLPLPVKHLLQSAAVVGKEVPLALLEAVAEESADDLRQGLGQLQAAEFLYETSLFPESVYTFKHALTLEVAYQSLVRERKRTLHERVLRAVEQRGGRGVDHIELLAHHAVRGERWKDAARYLFQAGEKALGQGRWAVSAGFYEQAVHALEQLGAEGDRTLKLDAYLELWVTRISSGQLDGLREIGEKAEALARALDDGPRLAKVQVRQAQALAVTGLIPGTFESAMAWAREAFDRAEPDDLRTRSYARFIAGLCCRDLGLFGEAIDEYGRGMALFPAPADSKEPVGLVFPIYVSLAGWRSETYAATGEMDAAIASAREAHRMAADIGHPSSLSIASAFLGYAHLLRGDLDRAIAVLERGLAVGEEHNVAHGVFAASLYLALALALQGRAEAGQVHLARALERPLLAFVSQWTRYGSVTASTYLAMGRLAEARAEITRGLTLVAERDARSYRAPLLRLSAELELAANPSAPNEALTPAQEALALARSLRARPEVAHTQTVLARAWARAGDPARAQEALADATATYRALGMDWWATRAKRGSV